jgi:Glycosyl transferase family 2
LRAYEHSSDELEITELFAPIVLFAYRRPEHLERTLAALRCNPEARDTELHIFCDGPKDNAAAAGVEAVRQVLRGLDGFRTIKVVYREKNFGLARNITEGVSEVLGKSGQAIIVEDDLVVSPFFLRYMNDALEFYRADRRVGSISGYCYPLDCSVPETFFIRGADCWGWATWRDRWCHYESDSNGLLAKLRERNLSHAFDFEGTMAFTQMLEDQIAGKVDSWAIRWHASCFLRDLLILYPGRPLAHNIGQDGSGTHTKSGTDAFDVTLSPTPVAVGGIAVEESCIGRAAIRAFFRSNAPPRTKREAGLRKVSRLLQRIRFRLGGRA